MNIRSKVSGTLAATALLFGGVIGVTAEEATTSATLKENLDGYSACYVEVDESNLDFGTFTWDGEKYDGQRTGTHVLHAYQDISPLDTDCDFTITGTDLKLAPGDESNVIRADEIFLSSGNYFSDTPMSAESAFTVTAIPTGTGKTHDIDWDLANSITSQKPGEYSGTLTVTAVGAQPGEETPEDLGV